MQGANLGFTADAYLAAGGFRPLPTAEDVALVNDLQAAGLPLLRTTRLPRSDLRPAPRPGRRTASRGCWAPSPQPTTPIPDRYKKPPEQDASQPAPGRHTWRMPSVTRAWNTGCGAVAGPRTTAPSLTRNTLPCQGQVRQSPASPPSESGPDR